MCEILPLDILYHVFIYCDGSELSYHTLRGTEVILYKKYQFPLVYAQEILLCVH